jgi:DNA/RNA endonuclease YhcR with UshA esterase domain
MNWVRRLLWPGPALLALLVGCGEAVAPAGTPSVVTVRAYVDADGSGGVSEGDVFIAGLQVTLEPTADGGVSLQATTDASGVATFDGVPPGSYRVVPSGAVPDGAVLATASAPVVAAPYQGGTLTAEFRYVFNPGEIAGRIFRDNNGNGVWDPGTDTPAPGIPVELFAGSTAAGEPVATTTTDAEGAFRFTVLRPGTYTYRFAPLPTMTIVGGTTQTVTVEAASTLQSAVRFTGSLISTIAQVRALSGPTFPALGETVAFEGVVSAGVGIFSTSATGNQFNVQDASGGILVLDTPLATGPQQGDSVRVIGRLQISSGELLIRSPTITVLATGRPVPAPRLLTAAQVASSTAADPLQGSLVRVPNVQVTAVSGSATSSSYNVTVTDEAGGSQFVIRVGSAAVGIPQPYWEVGRSYDITGLLASFNGAQIKVRSPADVEARSTAMPIADVRAAVFADSAGTRATSVTIEGVVHTAQGTLRTDNAYIQDATGGMLLFRVPTGMGLQLGDSVRVTGFIAWFNQELQLEGTSATVPLEIERLGTSAVPVPRTVSGAQIASRLFEGQLVRAANVQVLSIGSPSSVGGFDVNVRAPDGTEFRIRIENSSIGLPPSAWTVGATYTVVGPLGNFRGTPQIKPRGAADVTAGVASVISIAAAEQAALGDTVTVEGIVIAPVGPFGTSHAYIYDGTGGILIFGVPTSEITLQLGDVIRVTGLAAVFSGERQIARFSSSSLLQIERVGTSPLPAPRPVSGADIAARTYEGELVLLAGATVIAVGTVSSAGGYNVTMLAADGTELIVRHDRAAVGVPVETFVIGSVYDIIGIPAAFNSVPQLKFRGPADVVRR